MESSVTIDVPDNCEQEGCFLVTFANGELKSSSTKQPKFSLYHKGGGTATKKRKIMVAETDQMTYVGTNYDDNSQTSTANLCKYYIGALDRQTGRMTVQRAELMHLRPYIPGKTDVDLSEESPVKLEKSQVRDEMVALFGSERQKRAFAAYKRNKVDSGALETALASAVTEAGTSQEATGEAAASMQGSGLAPPFNPQAQTPQDVYNVSDIISLVDLAAVQVTGQVFTAATKEDIDQWRQQAKYPEYILSHVANLPSSEPERSLKASLLLYCNWLIQMYTQTHRGFEKKGLQLSGEVPPPDVEKNLLEKFSELLPDAARKPGKVPQRRVTSRMKDKILLHLLVLTLILDDFSVECSTLQQDLKVTTKKLMDNYKSLGCRVSKLGVKRKSGVAESPVDSTSCSAVLRIPLEFPRIRKGHKSR
jgi:DNA-directed RNA polymerase I subunit RPA49